MSRIGKNPITIPSGVEVNVNGREFNVKGKNGELSWSIPHAIDFDKTDSEITFSLRQTTKEARALWGLSRAMVANMVEGVSNGFSKKMEIKGVGYKAALKGKILNLIVGYSHPVDLDIPEGLTVKMEGATALEITGADKQLVGQFAANVRAVRPPEPYKGKGIRYADEHIIMKEGKKK